MDFFVEENQIKIPEFGVKMMLYALVAEVQVTVSGDKSKGCGNVDKASGS